MFVCRINNIILDFFPFVLRNLHSYMYVCICMVAKIVNHLRDLSLFYVLSGFKIMLEFGIHNGNEKSKYKFYFFWFIVLILFILIKICVIKYSLFLVLDLDFL